MIDEHYFASKTLDDIITYRGTKDIYFKNLNPGDEYVGGVFYSTSIDYVQAKVFADDATEYSEDDSKGMLLEIRVRKGSKALYIGNNTDYKSNGYTVNEKELLLSNKTKYRIIKKEDFKMILEVI